MQERFIEDIMVKNFGRFPLFHATGLWQRISWSASLQARRHKRNACPARQAKPSNGPGGPPSTAHTTSWSGRLEQQLTGGSPSTGRTTTWLVILGALWTLTACSPKKTELAWKTSFYKVGTLSSPRAADLNGDGILDIVLGAGEAEIADTEQGIIALNGADGSILWQHPADAHIVGSAVFHDITGDGVPDVFIGGRKHNLKALDGRDGALLWQYEYRHEGDPVLDYARYNFYNGPLVPDQDGDSYPDLLIVNGGNWDALPGSTEDRFPGVLMLFSLKTGAVIAADTMPDGRESYMSPLCFAQPGSDELQVVFGTGGETMSGHLYLASLSDLKNRKLNQARIIASETSHGFIAPPVLADVSGDGRYDIIAVSHAGTIQAIDGQTLKPLWEQRFEGMESSNSLAVGQFTGDETPDVLAVMNAGVWPDYKNTLQVLLDGADGNVAYRDQLGCFSLASPVAYDLDRDGYDEAILSINDYHCEMEFTEDILSPDTINNQLIFLNFQHPAPQVIDRTEGFRNIYSTPWIGDLDDDGYLDIVYCQNFNPNNLFLYLGMQVKRVSTSVRLRTAPRWGEYMGPAGRGAYPLSGD